MPSPISRSTVSLMAVLKPYQLDQPIGGTRSPLSSAAARWASSSSTPPTCHPPIVASGRNRVGSRASIARRRVDQAVDVAAGLAGVARRRRPAAGTPANLPAREGRAGRPRAIVIRFIIRGNSCLRNSDD